MPLSATQITLLLFAWGVYAGIHSLLASVAIKHRVAQRWPGAMRSYRLAFNALAALLLLPPLWLTFAFSGPLLWRWSGAWAWLANALAFAAIAAFGWTSRHYDMQSFTGLTQWRAREAVADEDAQLRISPLHRYVRHPWYFLGLVILWTRDMDAARLISALCITAYLWLGSLLEERKLLQIHGAAYARYRERVSGLVPFPGRTLSKAEAQALAECGKAGRDAGSLRKPGGGV
ncbi:hypothetical protein GPA25_00240 [Aromatoleum diolicum]|uniref:Methanethiol S-methyltransferase n=2 Tax=Aromatoleum diolicum TaxID=75796 RepID=A0ABX1Q6M5_9RHOO|nr:hypothetical protein [Aromatoleum diolicum]